MARILETRRLTSVATYFRLEGPLIAASAGPGQFIMLRGRESGERIPVTIADCDRDAGTLTVAVREVGATARRLCTPEAGDEILDVDGPCVDAHEADFEVAMRRNMAYVREEKIALDRYTCMTRKELR